VSLVLRHVNLGRRAKSLEAHPPAGKHGVKIFAALPGGGNGDCPTLRQVFLPMLQNMLSSCYRILPESRSTMERITRQAYWLRRSIALMVALGIIVLGVTLPAFFAGRAPEEPLPSEPSTPNNPPIVTPPVLPSPATTLPGAVIAVVDNNPQARPQSGLDRADLVIEVIAEGGITRFLAFFYSQSAQTIGPIRSARPYFAELVRPFSAPLAHVGGSEDALRRIRELRLTSLDEINNASRAFWRSTKRRMPFNLYTNTDLLISEANRRGAELAPLPPLPEGELPSGEALEQVTLTYAPDYRVTWRRNDGKYYRLLNETPHVMDDGGNIEAENIIIIEARHQSIVTDTVRSKIDVIGGGPAIFLRGGQLFRGTWEKKSADTHLIFRLGEVSFPFAQGVTWIQIVPSLGIVK